MKKEKDGNEYIEYQNDEVSSAVCQAILKQTYTIFRLFMGSFNTVLNEPDCGSVTLLKHKLDHFYSRVRIIYLIKMYIKSKNYNENLFL